MLDQNKTQRPNDETLLKFEQFLKTKTKIDQTLLKLIFNKRVMGHFKRYVETPKMLPDKKVIEKIESEIPLDDAAYKEILSKLEPDKNHSKDKIPPRNNKLLTELATNFSNIENETANTFTNDDKTEVNINLDNELFNRDTDNTNSPNDAYKEILDKISMTTENITKNLLSEGKKIPSNQMQNQKNLKEDINSLNSSREKTDQTQIKEFSGKDTNNSTQKAIETQKNMISSLDKVNISDKTEKPLNDEYNKILSKMSIPDKVTTETDTEAPFHNNIENDGGSFIQR